MINKNHKQYSCNICNKDYASSGSLWFHTNKFHNINLSKVNNNVNINVNTSVNTVNKNVNIVNKNINLQSSNHNYECSKCSKTFNCRQGRYQHEKRCKKINKIIQLEEENKKLKSQLEIISTSSNTNNTNNTLNNIYNGNINNIIINQIGKESIDCLKIKDILSIANDKLNGPITCIKKLNFNKNLPQNHSFCNTSLEGNYFTTINHKTLKKEKISKKDLINKVLNSSLEFIEGIALNLEFNKDYKDKIPIEDQEKIQYILNNKHKFYEKKNLLTFTNSINSMSYNYKDLIMSTWKLLQPLEEEKNNLSDIDSEIDYDLEEEPDVKEINHFSDSDSE